MERRDALKQMFVIGTGAFVLPSILIGCLGRSQLSLKRLKLSLNQELILESLVDTIIPQTDTFGAKELGVHVFIMKMIDDCFCETKIWEFQVGIEAFGKLKVNGKSFIASSARERRSFLGIDHGDIIQDFLTVIRNQTIEGYMYSEYVMTDLIPYKLVPGPFEGIVKIKS